MLRYVALLCILFPNLLQKQKQKQKQNENYNCWLCFTLTVIIYMRSVRSYAFPITITRTTYRYTQYSTNHFQYHLLYIYYIIILYYYII
jgi:hypothetical protein